MINSNINFTDKIYINCFYYSFYIEKNELIKYKNKNNELAINNLINTHLMNNILTKVKTVKCLTNLF